MNKKGFTLVELLAVVVVLVILALISIPIVTGIIDNVKKGAVKSSADGLLRAADMYYAKNMDKMKDPVEFEINDGVQVSKEKLDYNGNIKMGYLMLFSETKKAVCVDDGTYSAYKGVHDTKIKVIEGICTGEYDSETESYLVSQTSKGFTNLSIKSYTDVSKLPKTGNTNDIAIITETKITGYYVSSVAPTTPEEGMVWIVQANNSPYYLESAYVRIGVSYAMQYESGKWILKHAYVYNEEWKLLYYVDMTDGNINLENSNLGEIKIENTYEYTGEYQEFTATFSGYYNVQLWGAQGGHTSYGGKGAYTAGDIYLNAGDTIYIYVGEQPTSPTGGWNGGGTGYNGNSYVGYGGGGATDIRLVKTSNKLTWDEFESLKSRIMVAAGGGGGHTHDTNGGGPGGTLIGITGKSNYDSNYLATGGTQSMGGYVINNATLTVGGFGYGGSASKTNHTQGGGGSGYYGGAGAAYHYTGGGGGSSYVSGHLGCSSIDEDSTTTNIIHTGSRYHYSDYYFENTVMRDGNSDFIPSHDGTTTITGNSGNGYAKVTLLSVELKEEDNLISEKINSLTEWNYMYSGTDVYTGRYQEFTAEVSGIYSIQLWGAQGGHTSYGGKGSYTSGDIYLNKNEKLYLYVGSTPLSFSPGWNGGGTGYNGYDYIGYGGGGATDVRLEKTSLLTVWNEFESLKSRIMVAAGGGGGHTHDTNGGGAGGTLIGITGKSNYDSNYLATGGTQSMGGYVINNPTPTVGGFGYGGSASKTNHTQGGGGSGYYGGAGAAYHYTGGGGGSSYISGYLGCSSIDEDSTTTNIIHTGSRYHYSDYYFENTIMYSGSDPSMVTHDGSGTMTGNSGNGYAKIILKKKEQKESTELEDVSINNLTEWDYMYSGTDIYTGRYQSFVADKAGTYKIELWGAQGGHTSYGGKGAYTSGEIELNKGTKLYIYVGSTTLSLNSGWNGGGTGYNGYDYVGYGGGGSTDIRINKTSTISTWNEFTSLKSRIMVAAGGGGGHTHDSNGGGAGGGILGINGKSNYGSGYLTIGATQLVGGYAENNMTSSVGGFGYGGAASKSNHTQGGGGAGWYGGGGGAYHYTGGSGGSSYISGHAGCIGVTSSGKSKVNEYSELSDSISYTGYKFVNTQMIDGEGYPWTTTRSASSSGMVSPTTTSLVTGHTGSGYARITYLGN